MKLHLLFALVMLIAVPGMAQYYPFPDCMTDEFGCEPFTPGGVGYNYTSSPAYSIMSPVIPPECTFCSPGFCPDYCTAYWPYKPRPLDPDYPFTGPIMSCYWETGKGEEAGRETSPDGCSGGSQCVAKYCHVTIDYPFKIVRSYAQSCGGVQECGLPY